ncbi:MAG: hypothetical protein ACOYT4_01050 [Nanoarchaeota archaeon]
MNKNSLIGKKACLSYFQILILVIATFAFSYFLYKAMPVKAESSDLSLKCCEKSTKGEICKNTVNEGECDRNFKVSPSECDKTSFCQLGCCADKNEGIYEPNTREIDCKNSGGEWIAGKNCNLPEAKLGCCILGEKTDYVTNTKCSILSENRGVSKDWRPISEVECNLIPNLQDKGACVLEDKSCVFTTREECKAHTGSYSNFAGKDILCTAKDLVTTCKPTTETMCVEGKDEVYFKDSCGNPANIYDSSKINNEDYWEKIQTQGICLLNDKNIKTCGNCNRFLNGICKPAQEIEPKYGDYYCKPTTCEFIDKSNNKKNYRNGESWCEYEGKIGNGDDVVGSSHWIYSCDQGEIQGPNSCGDARTEICVQTDTDLGNGETFSKASCVVNKWAECVNYNSKDYESNMSQACTENPFCDLRHIQYTDEIKFDICTPKYPIGFNFDNEKNNGLCSMASFKCTRIEIKGLDGNWDCKVNCDCNKAEWIEKANDLCKSLGDCGAKVNIAKEFGSAGYTTYNYWDKKVITLRDSYVNKLRLMANYQPRQKAEIKEVLLDYLLGELNPNVAEEWEVKYNKPSSNDFFSGELGKGTGWAFLALSSATYMSYGAGLTEAIQLSMAHGSAGAFGPAYAGFANALGSFSLGMVTASIMVKIFNLKGDAAKAVMWTGAAVGAGSVAITATFSSTYAGCLATTVWALVCVAIIVIISAILKWAGVGDSRKKTYEFTCQPWQPPYGGANCEECNSDDLPCSEYRCRSLGASCEFINKGTEDELCIYNNLDPTPPQISPQKETLSDNLIYANEKKGKGFEIKSKDEECLEPKQFIKFGINTDDPAHCFYSNEMTEFENMIDFGPASFVYNHTLEYYLEDPSRGAGGENKVELPFYVKCINKDGNQFNNFYEIKMCIKSGPDVRLPSILHTIPEDSSSISSNAEGLETEIFTDELVECKWSHEDKSYDNMENNMSCGNAILDRTAYGYYCQANITELKAGENKIYVRCKDQPYLEMLDPEKRNENKQGFIYTILKAEKPLTIDWIEPSEDFDSATSFNDITIKVHTSGGSNEENHMCAYNVGYDFIPFFHTYSALHEQNINVFSGMNTIKIECMDLETKEKISNQTTFTINYDENSPEIARIYQEGTNIIIVTTEESECRYSTDSCEFDFEKAKVMRKSGNKHSVDVLSGLYYIKCKDKFGNVPYSCSMTAKPVKFE